MSQQLYCSSAKTITAGATKYNKQMTQLLTTQVLNRTEQDNDLTWNAGWYGASPSKESKLFFQEASKAEALYLKVTIN